MELCDHGIPLEAAECIQCDAAIHRLSPGYPSCQDSGYSLFKRFGRPETMLMNIFEREGWYENRVTDLEAEITRLRGVLLSIAESDKPYDDNSPRHVSRGAIILSAKQSIAKSV